MVSHSNKPDLVAYLVVIMPQDSGPVVNVTSLVLCLFGNWKLKLIPTAHRETSTAIGNRYARRRRQQSHRLIAIVDA
jgi:hypothetical protein